MLSSEQSSAFILQYLTYRCHPNCLFVETVWEVWEGSNSTKAQNQALVIHRLFILKHFCWNCTNLHARFWLQGQNTQGTGIFSTSDNVAGTRQLFAGMRTKSYRLYRAPCVCIYRHLSNYKLHNFVCDMWCDPLIAFSFINTSWRVKVGEVGGGSKEGSVNILSLMSVTTNKLFSEHSEPHVCNYKQTVQWTFWASCL